MKKNLFLALPKYLKEVTEQVALGGGEPFLKPELVRDFAAECAKNGIIVNVTTNGSMIKKWTDKQVKDYLKHITMVSVSFDREKVPNMKKFKDYIEIMRKLKKNGVQVGCNLLIDKSMFNEKMLFIKLVTFMFGIGVDRVFALYPKNIDMIDILPYENWFKFLSIKYKHFYVDDLMKMIIEGKSYDNWKLPCHFGKDIVSIDEFGNVMGCSFDGINKSALKIEKPEDILKINDLKFDERFECPYLKKVVANES
jgi:MoaA/NifB/PqqE/SkfB family radical SAM enzyme